MAKCHKNMELIKKNNKYYMSENAYVMCVRNTDIIYEPEHTHDFFEIAYTLKGRCEHSINGKTILAKHGDALIINYNQTHSINVLSGTEYINILIKPEYINKSLINNENAFALLHLTEFEDFSKILDENKTKVTFAGEERDQLEGIINNIIAEIENKSPGYELLIRSQFNILLIMMFRKMSLKMDESFNGISDKLLAYISQNCSKKLTLESVSRLCSYNKSYFSRIFKDYTGFTFTEYLNKARIEKATVMLAETDNNITDIVYNVGYSDKTKFFKHFKAITGMTPLQYKKVKNKYFFK